MEGDVDPEEASGGSRKMGKTPKTRTSAVVRMKNSAPAPARKVRVRKGPTIEELLVAFFPDPAAWLAAPNDHFGGRKPGDLLGTDEEVKVYHLLRAVDMGLY